MSESTKMEVTESIGSPEEQGPRSPDEKPNDNVISEEHKQKLFEKLINTRHENPNKSLSLAMTIQTMFKDNLEVLIQLFECYLDMNQLDLAQDLIENDLLKNFNLNDTDLFNFHLSKFSSQIISNLSIKSISNRSPIKNEKDEFYLKLFLKLNQTTQEKIVKQLFEKYKSNLSFFKTYSEVNVDKSKQQQVNQFQNIDFKDFYVKLAQNRNNLYEFRDLLLIYRKFIPDYGIFLIDSFLNIDKNFYMYIVHKNQIAASNNTHIDPILTSLERRSLNIMRRLCVVDLIPEFVYLIDKLDNRHCYRWIEKSLEFFCKYAINSIQFEVLNSNENEFKINYLPVRLMHDSELKLCESPEQLVSDEFIKELRDSLSGLDDYKFCSNSSTPFLNVYKLLDELGKKLDWPNIVSSQANVPVSSMPIEEKMTFLFNLKQKNDKNISVSSLNKQISFYGISFFFSKLIEFQAACKSIFSDMLVMSQSFISTISSDKIASISYKTDDVIMSDQIDYALSNLVFSLKLWQKFNQHKEYLTIINKCLSNSKLDSLNCYKVFLSEYYNNFSMASSSNVNNQSYNSLTGMNNKQKIPMLANLFKYENSTFQNFFNEFNQIIDQLESDQSLSSQKNKFYGYVYLSNIHFDLFEINQNNFLKYYSRIFLDKIFQIYEQKKQTLLKFLSQNDLFLGQILVIIQTNLNDDLIMTRTLMTDFYDSILQLLKSKTSFHYPQFFDYIYDLKILQDICTLTKIQSKLKLGVDKPLEKIINIINQDNNKLNRIDIFKSFLKKNNQSIMEMFDQIVKV